MVGQPPFAVTSTAIGTATEALSLTDPLATAQPGETTNNYGVQRDYALGAVQTWNADLSRDLRQVWNVGAGYTHTRGSSLDILRAPNRGPDGLRIDGVQPFLWQSSEGSSTLHAATFRAAAAAGERHRLRRHLHARPLARQRLLDRRRRHRSSPRTIATSTRNGGSRASIAATS